MDKALLLVESSDASTAGRLEKVLAIFGVACERLTVLEFLVACRNTTDGSKSRLLGTASAFLNLVGTLDINPEARLNWQTNVHSALVFAENDLDSFVKLTREVTGDANISLKKVDPGAAWVVTSELPEFCQSMSGVRVAAKEGTESGLVCDGTKPGTAKIIGGPDGAALIRSEFHGVPIFLSTAGVINMDAPLSGRDFDIRTHFLSATPVAMYVKWAFSETCWQPPETCACLVIDDPLLKPRYGCLKYKQLLDLMERVNFSTSIAFIPWNWKRSSKEIVQLFRENPGRFSLSIHGCDHTGGEFGSRHIGRLAWKSKQAMQRMARHQSRTGLPHDPVMVFPQGVFSAASMAVLKRGEFIGAVNSEVISTDREPPTVKIADYWNVAVMNYSDFPIFTRRYPWAGVENFAFDILLGKPCIVVVHHGDCHDDCRHVVEFMERLNRLNARLRWTNLAEVVRRSFRQREISPGVMEVEMFANEARLENHSGTGKIFRCTKQESNAADIKDIRVAAQPVRWTAAKDRISFEVQLGPGENKTVAITFTRPADAGFAGESVRYRIKAMVRRYLCEFRDNYVMRKSFSQ